MAEFLYDQPRQYFVYGCTTDGKFDPEKAKALGYGPAQYAAIQEFLGVELDYRAEGWTVEFEAGKDTAPLVEPEEEETGG